jgi:hypothetical protein
VHQSKQMSAAEAFTRHSLATLLAPHLPPELTQLIAAYAQALPALYLLAPSASHTSSTTHHLQWIMRYNADLHTFEWLHVATGVTADNRGRCPFVGCSAAVQHSPPPARICLWHSGISACLHTSDLKLYALPELNVAREAAGTCVVGGVVMAVGGHSVREPILRSLRSVEVLLSSDNVTLHFLAAAPFLLGFVCLTASLPFSALDEACL